MSFSSSLWPNISDEGKDLIKKLLVIEPKNRLSAQEALVHPWFDKFCPTITLRHNANKYAENL